MSNEQKIAAIAATAQAVNGEVRDDYSGRGMMGQRCYGIDCNDDTECVVQASRRGLPRPSIDSMGLGYIVYWPSVSANNESLTEANQQSA